MKYQEQENKIEYRVLVYNKTYIHDRHIETIPEETLEQFKASFANNANYAYSIKAKLVNGYLVA